MVIEIHSHGRQGLVYHTSQYYGCWWPGDIRSQGISTHSIGLVHLDYSSHGINRVNDDCSEGLIFISYTWCICTSSNKSFKYFFVLFQTCRTLIDQAFLDCSDGIKQAQNSCLSMVNTLGDVYHIARDVLDKLNPELWAPKHVVLQKRQVFGIDK